MKTVNHKDDVAAQSRYGNDARALALTLCFTLVFTPFGLTWGDALSNAGAEGQALGETISLDAMPATTSSNEIVMPSTDGTINVSEATASPAPPSTWDTQLNTLYPDYNAELNILTTYGDVGISGTPDTIHAWDTAISNASPSYDTAINTGASGYGAGGMVINQEELFPTESGSGGQDQSTVEGAFIDRDEPGTEAKRTIS